ncbi:unnamed protein product [Urochloa humidicola]
MSFRRFLYLAADDWIDRGHSLRRLDTSRFFFPRRSPSSPPTERRAPTPPTQTPTPLDGSGGAGATDPLAMPDAAGSLPDPALSHLGRVLIDFALFKSTGRDAGGGETSSPQVVSLDRRGRAFMCDPTPPPEFIPLPAATPRILPFSLTVVDSLYVMDAFPDPAPPNGGGSGRSFEALTFGHRDSCYSKEWYWRSLPPPPPLVHHGGGGPPNNCIESYALAAGGADILVSDRVGKRTYRFDTARGEWWKNAAGDWPMPFTFLAEYVPEHGLWFGISPLADGRRFMAANLMLPESEETAMGMCSPPPVVHGCWKEFVQPPPEWSLGESHAVYLGSSMFCIVRFFRVGKLCVCPATRKRFKVDEEVRAVITGVEVESRGQELRVMKHKSECYKLDIRNCYLVF